MDNKNPFAGIKFHEVEVNKQFLSQAEINKIWQKEFKIKRLELVRDVFIFCGFTFVALTNVCLIINRLQTNNRGIGNGLETTCLHHLHDSQSFQIAQCEDNIILRINQILIIKIIQIQRITGYGC